MTLYCLKAQYTPQAIAAIVKSGTNREDAARKAIESAGGKLHGFYGIFGDNDGYHVMVIVEMPGNAHYLATVMSVILGGTFAKFTTNVLYTADDVVSASEMVNASGVDYQPPSA